MDKQDLLEGCISDISGKGDRDYKAFQETFCARCRNPECVHAQWSKDKFSARVSTQEDRFFNTPQIVATEHPKFAQIPDFINMFQEAIRLEAADRLGDWSIPDVPKFNVGGAPKEDPVVEAAVQNMMLEDAPSEDPEEDAPLPEEDATPVEPEVPVTIPKPVPSVTPTTPVTTVHVGNTSVKDGIMIGGATPPVLSPVTKEDPWAPKPKVIQPGATITMGQKSDG